MFAFAATSLALMTAAPTALSKLAGRTLVSAQSNITSASVPVIPDEFYAEITSNATGAFSLLLFTPQRW